jgi:hypothetical protein
MSAAKVKLWRAPGLSPRDAIIDICGQGVAGSARQTSAKLSAL